MAFLTGDIHRLLDDDSNEKDFSASSGNDYQEPADNKYTRRVIGCGITKKVSKRKTETCGKITYLDLTSHTIIVDEEHMQ